MVLVCLNVCFLLSVQVISKCSILSNTYVAQIAKQQFKRWEHRELHKVGSMKQLNCCLIWPPAQQHKMGVHSFFLVAGCICEPCNLLNKAMLPLVVHEDTAMACT